MTKKKYKVIVEWPLSGRQIVGTIQSEDDLDEVHVSILETIRNREPICFGASPDGLRTAVVPFEGMVCRVLTEAQFRKLEEQTKAQLEQARREHMRQGLGSPVAVPNSPIPIIGRK